MRGVSPSRAPAEGILCQPARFLSGEVAQAQEFRRDVKRAAAGDHLAGAGLDAVVPDVADAAEHDAVREAPGPLLVAGAQLAQHGEQGVAHQRIDLVDQRHQRRRFVRHRSISKSFKVSSGPDCSKTPG